MTAHTTAIAVAFLPWGMMAFTAARARQDFRRRLRRRHPDVHEAVYGRGALPPLLDITGWLERLRFELGAPLRFAADAPLAPLATRLRRTLWASFATYGLALGYVALHALP